MEVSGEFPLIAVLGGGGAVILCIILYQIILRDGPGPDPFRERSAAQTSYMMGVIECNRRTLWEMAKRDT